MPSQRQNMMIRYGSKKIALNVVCLCICLLLLNIILYWRIGLFVHLFCSWTSNHKLHYP